MDQWWVLAVFLLFGGTLIGIFKTKTKGFGRFSTSVVLLVLVLFVAAIAFILGKLELQPLANLLFAIAGYAGGLLTSKDAKKDDPDDKDDPADHRPGDAALRTRV